MQVRDKGGFVCKIVFLFRMLADRQIKAGLDPTNQAPSNPIARARQEYNLRQEYNSVANAKQIYDLIDEQGTTGY